MAKFHDISRPRMIQWVGLALFILGGMGCVLYYTYLRIQHDMNLITAKQNKVFEAFYQRATILDAQALSNFVDRHNGWQKLLTHKGAEGYVYSYGLKTRKRIPDIPLHNPDANSLNAFRYVLSYPAVINLYTISNDHRLQGMVSDHRELPSELNHINAVMMRFAPWHYYFGCSNFTNRYELCNRSKAYVSDLRKKLLSKNETVVMYFPFNHHQGEDKPSHYGLLGIGIAVDVAFRNVLHPFETLNPTHTAVTFNASKPCRAKQICLSKPFMRTKGGAYLHLKWSYSWFDFAKVALHSTAFDIYIILLLLMVIGWKHLYQRFRSLAHTDNLTRLPRRDILNEAMLHEHDYLMILDIDNFKSINDGYGHAVGDLALMAFARHLKSNTRKVDSAIRWGGEEFVLLFKEIEDNEMMNHSAERLLSTPLRIAELPAPITFSAGMIPIRNHLTVTEAVHLADELLYHVKQHGKHNIACYEGQEIRLIRPQSDDAGSV